MYNETVTLFMQYRDRQRNVYWYPSVLRNAHLNMDKSAIIAKYGPDSQDNATLNVRYTRDEDGNIVVGGKRWLPPKEWDNQLNDDYSNTITFADGTAFDFFYVGEWPDEDVIADEDYDMSEGFYNYMNNKYDYVFAITAVGGPYSVIPHFEIMGR